MYATRASYLLFHAFNEPEILPDHVSPHSAFLRSSQLHEAASLHFMSHMTPIRPWRTNTRDMILLSCGGGLDSKFKNFLRRSLKIMGAGSLSRALDQSSAHLASQVAGPQGKVMWMSWGDVARGLENREAYWTSHVKHIKYNLYPSQPG